MQGSVHITMAIWKELEEMAENLESHMDEPDVKEQMGGTLSWSADFQPECSWRAGDVEQWSEGQNELGINEVPGCNKPRKPDFNRSGWLHAFSQCCCWEFGCHSYAHEHTDMSTSICCNPNEDRSCKVQDFIARASLDQYLPMTDPFGVLFTRRSPSPGHTACQVWLWHSAGRTGTA